MSLYWCTRHAAHPPGSEGYADSFLRREGVLIQAGYEEAAFDAMESMYPNDCLESPLKLRFMVSPFKKWYEAYRKWVSANGWCAKCTRPWQESICICGNFHRVPEGLFCLTDEDVG